MTTAMPDALQKRLARLREEADRAFRIDASYAVAMAKAGHRLRAGLDLSAEERAERKKARDREAYHARKASDDGELVAGVGARADAAAREGPYGGPRGQVRNT